MALSSADYGITRSPNSKEYLELSRISAMELFSRKKCSTKQFSTKRYISISGKIFKFSYVFTSCLCNLAG